VRSSEIPTNIRSCKRLSALGQRPVAGCCEHDNELPGSVKVLNIRE
jgi:hypothetical protein